MKENVPTTFWGRIKASEIEQGPEISSGKYGTVYSAKVRGNEVAIKVLHHNVTLSLSSNKVEELMREVAILRYDTSFPFNPNTIQTNRNRNDTKR